MAAPVVAGIFGGFFQFATLWFGYKTALRVAAVGALFSMWLLFTGVAMVLLQGLAESLPAWAQQGAMFLPSNLSPCIGAYLSAHVALNAYHMQKKLLKIGLYTH